MTAATINVVGGFMITDRMLKMFQRERSGKASDEASSHDSYCSTAYLAASVLFILGLKALNSPKTARRGMLLADARHAGGRVGTLFASTSSSSSGFSLGSSSARPSARDGDLDADDRHAAADRDLARLRALAATLVGIVELLRATCLTIRSSAQWPHSASR